MNIYIAGPFSTEKERESLKHMIELVRNYYQGIDLYIPMEYKVPDDFQKLDGTWNLSNEVWANKVFVHDKEKLDKADIVFALYVGHYHSSGTVWEIGYACGKEIPVIIYIPEWAKGDMSLMVLNGIDRRLTEEGKIISITKEYLSQFNQK